MKSMRQRALALGALRMQARSRSNAPVYSPERQRGGEEVRGAYSAVHLAAGGGSSLWEVDAPARAGHTTHTILSQQDEANIHHKTEIERRIMSVSSMCTELN